MAKKPDSPSADSMPITQERSDFRKGWPSWLRQMPRISEFRPPDPEFGLIKEGELDKFFEENKISKKIQASIKDDVEYAKYELLRLFRERDYDAAVHQNRYRLFQLGYIILATLATLIGSFMALSLNSNPDIVPLLGFLETLVALLTTFIATISGSDPPFAHYLENRRKAEFLRREYFRYLCDLDPYSEKEGAAREMLLSQRAARINKGYFPDNPEDQK